MSDKNPSKIREVATKWVAEQTPVEPAERGTHWGRITTVGGRP